jgi:hypothetical protein
MFRNTMTDSTELNASETAYVKNAPLADCGGIVAGGAAVNWYVPVELCSAGRYVV